jgi:hypothetical protein
MITEQLASQKDFNALSATERRHVLTEMSQMEYDHLRKVLLATQQLETTALPPAHLRTKLLARMSAQPKPSVFRRLLTTPIPMWQAAAILMLGIATVAMNKETIVVEKNTTAWQWRVDTVFQEKVLWRDRIVLKSKIVYREKPLVPPMASAPAKMDSLGAIPDFQANELSDTPIGTSLGDTPELMEFFTQGDR